MTFYLHYLVLAPLCLLALLAVTLPTREPHRVLGRALAELIRPHGRIILGLYLFVVIGNLIEALLDDELTAALGYELTGFVFSIEGESVAKVQDAILGLPGGSAWIWILCIVYTAGYVTWLLYPPVALSAIGKPRAAGTYALAFALNYVLALPFYLFAPVKEVAWSGISRARPLLEENFPGITPHLRLESALDNCFPSLHVSIAFSSLVLVHLHGTRRMRMAAWPLTLGITLSVMALGIHWVADTVAGVPFGIACAFLAMRIMRGWKPEPDAAEGSTTSAVRADGDRATAGDRANR